MKLPNILTIRQAVTIAIACLILDVFLRLFVGSASDYKALAAVDDTPEARAIWNEAKRTSLNDICGRAFQIADSLEKQAA